VQLADTRPDAFLHWLTQLKAEVGIAAKLSAHGIVAAQIPRLSQLAFEDSCHLNNPRPVTRADFETIFRNAL
jgi:alcohol dehydrogenase class IV